MNYLLLVSVEAVAFMALISVVAYLKTPAGAKLPMQWGLDRQVTWRAPKLWAVMAIPALAAILLVLYSVLIARVPDVVTDPTTYAIVKASMYIMAGLFVIIHAAHMYFAVKDVGKIK